MMNMKYLGKSFDCKTFFKGSDTEMGRCFITNRLLDQTIIADNFDDLPMKFSSAGHVDRSIYFEYNDLQYAAIMVRLFE